MLWSKIVKSQKIVNIEIDFFSIVNYLQINKLRLEKAESQKVKPLLQIVKKSRKT